MKFIRDKLISLPTIFKNNHLFGKLEILKNNSELIII